ncbi:hypothetical protein ACSNOI_16765 [Actinomadura kijaniata]|uniref:hypothetical protein n=1 Tax=Actinomadura kijaniata TaxID=46161 RepID=UPI003F1CA915
MRVPVVEDEPSMAGAIRDGLRREAIAAGIAVLDGDVPMSCGGELAEHTAASGDTSILVLAAAVGTEELPEGARDENADPFTNAVRVTVSARVPGVGCRTGSRPVAGHEGGERG